MAKREVELVIRARDQAKAAVDGITKSLQELVEQQGNLSKSGAAANTTLSRLGTEFQTLQKNAAGLTALSRVARDLDRASGETDRLEKSLREAQSRLGAISGVVRQASLVFLQLQEAATRAGQALDRERASLAQARAEQARLNGEVAAAKERYQNLIVALRNQKGASDAAREAVRQQQATLISLIEAQTRQNAAVNAQRTAVRAAGQAFSTLSAQVKTAGADLRAANIEFERAAIAARAETAAVDEAKTALSEIRNVAGGAAQALGGVEVKQEALKQESERVAVAIQKVSDALLRQQQATRAATAAGGSAGTQATSAAFKAQQQAVDQARLAFRAAREELARLKAEFSATTAPSAALRAELEAARANASAAGVAWRAQTEALTQLRGALRDAANQQRLKITADRESQIAALAAADAAAQAAAAQNRAAIAAGLLGRDITTLNNGLRQTGAAAGQAAQGVTQFADQSRRALSLMQRFRGEVLSLATQFVGLYAAITQIGGVIEAIRNIEAAQSRLNAVFENDSGRVRGELRFLSQEADRLGLSFRVLSQEYGRFAIATDAANFTNEATRRIFISVAEAARVNKASTEELSGIFLALQQIVSKGTVSMEELRRQLGDRLPGAFNIFAEALGVTTAELDRMIRQGEVVASQDTLLKFADELERRFGGSLPASLETVTTQIDRFQNNIFEAQARIGAGGFTDALEDSLRRLNEFFKSREGRDFFLELGSLLGQVVRVLDFVVANFDLLVAVFQAFVTVRISQAVVGIVTALRASSVVAVQAAQSFLALDAAQQKQILTESTLAVRVAATGVALRALIGSAATAAVSIVTTGAASTATAAAMGRLAAGAALAGVAIRGLIAALGPVAIVALAITALISVFGQTQDAIVDTSRALDEHNRILDQYETEVREAERAGRAFNASLVETTAFEARANLEQLAAAYTDTRKASTEAARDIIGDWRRQNEEFRDNAAVREIQRLTKQLQDGTLSVKSYQERLREMADELEGPAAISITGLIARLHAQQDELRATEQALGTQAAVVQRLGGDLGDLTQFYRAVGIEVDQATGAIRSFTDALDEQRQAAAEAASIEQALIQGIPARAREAERNAAREAVDEQERQIRALDITADRQKELLDLVEERRSAVERQFREEDARDSRRGSRNSRNEQREFNEEIQRTNDLRRFELEQLQRSNREREIEAAVFEARTRANDRGVTFSPDQEAEVRATTAAIFDATEAERVRNLVLEQQVRLRELLGQVVSVQQEITEEAARQGIDLATAEGQAWAEVTRQVIERTRAEQELKRQVEEVTALERQRQEMIREFEAARAAGELNGAEQQAQLAQIELMRQQIEAARQAALELARALGDEAAIARLERMNSVLTEQEQKVREIATRVNEMFAQGATDAILNATDAIGAAIAGTTSWGEALENVGDAFRQFAADFLRQIAQMIIQALILKAIQSSGLGGLIGGTVAEAGTAHRGGIAGMHMGPKKRVNMAAFAAAARYHTGGFAGLRRDEVPAILQRGEEIIANNDPRHAANGGGAAPQVGVRIVNTIDSGEFVAKGLETVQGFQTLMNVIRSNRVAINGALA